MTSNNRSYYSLAPNMPKKVIADLGPLASLLGTWKGKGTGWNMIALPFKDSSNPDVPYRILMNQFDEELKFNFVADNVPNRGIKNDQEVATLDYQQVIAQIAVDDFPPSKVKGKKGDVIHHEPGLWIYVKNGEERINGINIARLASIPHGNSILALGRTNEKFVAGPPTIPRINALPFGRFENLATKGYDVFENNEAGDPKGDPYLAPYKHYIDKPFQGVFHPGDMTEILRDANKCVDIEATLELTVDSKIEDGGVHNMPFTTREAEPVSMRSTFWIQRLKPKGKGAKPRLRLQYSQIVMLDFFSPREDQMPGRAQWPHVSINTLEKVDDYSVD